MDKVVDFLISPGPIILIIIIVSGIIVHFKGKRKHGFVRQMFDHSTFMAPINLLMYGFSKVPNKPYLKLSDFPELQKVQENWEVIREEALELERSRQIRGSDTYNDIGFNSFFRRGWKRFYLKWYGDYHQSAKNICPRTIEMIEQMPSIKA
ncbi:MAG: aspartyl/asparaginyl beta-hydroxylase domain-containing protein, partial [Aurantibacter sp.]